MQKSERPITSACKQREQFRQLPSGKRPISVAGYVAFGDQDFIRRRLEPALMPIVGPVAITWTGRSEDGRPAIASDAIPPDKAVAFSQAIRETIGAHCRVNLTYRF